MAHFAQIDENNVVIEVLKVPDNEEHRGHEFLSVDCNLGGTWIQTSYNHKIRKQYAGKGYTYDPTNDIFISPQPFPSWSLDENFDWQAPYPKPEGDYYWDEESLSWIEKINTSG